MDSPPQPYHLSQLAGLCRRYPADEKVVFVPSLQIGHNLGTALARTGCSWLNLRITTPAAWAERVAGSELRSEGFRPLVQDADAFFLHASIRSEPWQDDHPFVHGQSSTGFARTILRTIRGLRLAGIDPVDVGRSVPGYAGILGRHYAAYCWWLDEEGYYDRALLYSRAALKEPRGQSVFGILDETPLPELAFEFVRACSGGDVVRIGRDYRGAPLPEHAAGVRFSAAPYVPANGSFGRGGLLQASGLSEDDRDTVALRCAVGVEYEIKGVLRELTARGTALDEVEIAYTSENPYLSYLVEESERLGFPVTFAAGVPVTYTRPGQALLGFLRWIASGFDPHVLVRLFRSRLIYLGADAGALDLATIGAVLQDARIAPGRHAWRNALERYMDRLAERLAATDSEGSRRYLTYRYDAATRFTRHLEMLYGLCPPDGTAPVAALAASAADFLDAFAAWEGDRDKRARESLSDRLRDLGEGAAIEGSVAELAAMLAELIESHKVEAAVARAGHLYVVPLDRAGYSGRSNLVVLGMAEKTFPGPTLEDPILLDSERERFGGRLKQQRVRAGEPAFHLVRAMGMMPGHVTLTAATRDVVDGREIYPAALFEQAKDQLRIENPETYSLVPDPTRTLTDAEVALSLRGDARAAAPIAGEYPWLIDGRIAARARAADGLGEYDGWLAEPTPQLRPGEETVLSASRLEDLAACPYRYFLKNVLHVRPPDAPEDLPDRWLTPLEFGALLHDVLKAFMERVAAEGESVDVERHAALMDEIVEMEIDLYREHIPVQLEAGFRADRHRIDRAVRVFLAEETRRNARPVGFEVSFGMGQTGPLDIPDPVELRLYDGVVFSLRGAIDRVDRTDDGFEVWDYKTGSTFGFDENELLSGGRRLQWALYAYVLEDILRLKGLEGSVRQSGYFFTSDREHGLRLSEVPPDRHEIGRQLKPLFDLVGKGAFLHVQKSKSCKYCDYAEVCSTERKVSKHMGDIVSSALPEHDFIDALGEWMEYEV